MKKMDFDQMESINGGFDWCFVGKGISGIGGGILILGGTFTGGLSALAYATITAATIMYC
jgi:hypothetical protein